METKTKNNIFSIALVTLALGLVIGYFVGTGRPGTQVPPTVPSMHEAMDGMTSSLAGKTGDALDKAFLNEMIVHHEGAIEMAQTLLQSTKRPELQKLGNDIITAQTQEIQMMNGWRTAWFGQ
ncbi:MAG: DUF305 domain-containing protein [Candidatus Kaiserbacteria bacterium]|nr:DUF305 domain-containing protein [Candidatus Kaiserbacteria bacterium]